MHASAIGIPALARDWLAAPFIAHAQAQVGAPATSVAPPPELGPGSLLGVAIALIGLAGLLFLVAAAVKVYDVWERRETEGVALQARLSDSLMLDRRLSGFSVIASVHVPVWRRSLPVVTLTGTVAAPELRETALQIVERELEGSAACIEDRIAVDPLHFRRVA